MYTPTRTSRPRVLLTGFDAFGGASLNPSWLAVQALHGRQVQGHRVVAAQLPTVFGASLKALSAEMEPRGSRLILRRGNAAQVLNDLIHPLMAMGWGFIFLSDQFSFKYHL